MTVSLANDLAGEISEESTVQLWTADMIFGMSTIWADLAQLRAGAFLLLRLPCDLLFVFFSFFPSCVLFHLDRPHSSDQRC